MKNGVVVALLLIVTVAAAAVAPFVGSTIKRTVNQVSTSRGEFAPSLGVVLDSPFPLRCCGFGCPPLFRFCRVVVRSFPSCPCFHDTSEMAGDGAAR